MELNPNHNNPLSGLNVFCKYFIYIFLTVTGSLLVGNDYSSADELEEDLMELSLEELVNINITSVSRKEEHLFNTSAAIYVITNEDIRRFGARTIPETLRMVPGLQVAQIDGNKWAISARGFNQLFSSKLLVMIDGRTVYTPVFAGVYWDVQDTLLADVDRIEVTRGPGGTLWGANAVNGVINIITKKAKDTQGGIVTVGTGTAGTNSGSSMRYGAQMSDNAHYRVYAKYNKQASFSDRSSKGADEWDATRAGFRVDWDVSDDSSLTVQGDGYYGESGQKVRAVVSPATPFFANIDDDVQVSGGNILARWKKTLSQKSDMQFQFYYDRAGRQEALLGQTVDTFDLDFQRRFPLGEKQEIIWGLSQRIITDHFNNSFGVSITPSNDVQYKTGAFIQDTIEIVENRFSITVGSKFEINSRTDIEIQPSARFLWTPNKRHSVWGAVSRAVRTPARTDDDFRLNASGFQAGPTATIVQVRGNEGFDSEELIALELGYRVQPKEELFLDISGFVNFYDNLSATEQVSSFTEAEPAPSHTISPSRFENNLNAETYGLELAANWKPVEKWLLKAGFTWFKTHLHLESNSRNTTAESAEGNDPEYQFNLRSLLKLPHDMEFDTAFFYVDDISNQNVDDYLRLDIRFGWQPSNDLELSLSFQNLLDPQHPEFGNQGGVISSEVPRSVHGKIVWKF